MKFLNAFKDFLMFIIQFVFDISMSLLALAMVVLVLVGVCYIIRTTVEEIKHDSKNL